MVHIDQKLKAVMLGIIPGVLNHDGKSYLQYDRVTVDTVTGRVSFFWQGQPMFYQEPTHFVAGDSITITGIDGKMQVTSL